MFLWLAPALPGRAQIPSAAPAATLSAAPRHKAQVNDPVLASRLAASGARRIADYGGFQLFDLDHATATALAGQIELRDEYNVIQLNAARLDTSLPQIQALRKPAAALGRQTDALGSFCRAGAARLAGFPAPGRRADCQLYSAKRLSGLWRCRGPGADSGAGGPGAAHPMGRCLSGRLQDSSEGQTRGRPGQPASRSARSGLPSS